MSYILLFVLLMISYFIGSIQGSYISSVYIYKDDKVLSDWQEYKTVHTFTRERFSVAFIDGIKILFPVLLLRFMAPFMELDYHFASLLGGGMATLGHLFPFFKRGKGEAMEAFVITSLFVSFPSSLISIAIFAFLYLFFGRKTLPFVVSVFSFPLLLILFFTPTFETGIVSILYSILIFGRQKKAVNTYLSE